jgi:hypothetical protein
LKDGFVILLKDPFHIVASDLTSEIGKPRDIKVNLEQNGSCNFEQSFSIPRPLSVTHSSTTSMIVDQTEQQSNTDMMQSSSIIQKPPNHTTNGDHTRLSYQKNG